MNNTTSTDVEKKEDKPKKKKKKESKLKKIERIKKGLKKIFSDERLKRDMHHSMRMIQYMDSDTYGVHKDMYVLWPTRSYEN